MKEDPRVYRALGKLREIGKVFLLLSVKGGVGKTTLSVLLAVAASKRYDGVGLLDLDFVNPSTHVLLGLNPRDIKYEEQRGLNPVRVKNLLYFTIAPFTQGHPLPLHGKGARNLLWEVLSIVNWSDAKVLFADTPPGLGDEHLEILYGLRGIATPVLVTTPSRLSLATVSNYLSFLREIGYTRVYLVENMGNGVLKSFSDELGAIYAGYLPYLPLLEECTGKFEKLERIAEEVTMILHTLIEGFSQ